MLHLKMYGKLYSERHHATFPLLVLILNHETTSLSVLTQTMWAPKLKMRYMVFEKPYVKVGKFFHSKMMQLWLDMKTH